jgi:acyl-coenzyme A thioesterase PaaI-like protein
MAITMTAEPVSVPTEAALRALCAREHAHCFACRPVADGGLGLRFSVGADGGVAAGWLGPAEFQSYEGMLHGGLIATVLDSAMVHALFSLGIVAQTADLRVRYRLPVRTTKQLEIHAWLQRSFGPLHELEAEIHQDGAVCAKAWGKFMATAASDASVSAASDYVAAPRGFGVAEQKRTHSREGKFRE